MIRKNQKAPNKRRKVVFALLVSAMLALLGAGFRAAWQRPFEFIDEYHGQRIPCPAFARIGDQCYAFSATSGDLFIVIASELQSKGWPATQMSVGDKSSRFFKGEEVIDLEERRPSDDLPTNSSCYVRIAPAPNPLSEVWESFLKRTGIR
jgi:hypothetical protein